VALGGGHSYKNSIKETIKRLKNEKYILQLLIKMFCLKVIIAYPDPKYPYAEVIVEHFESNEKAEIRLNEIKLQYNKNFGLGNENLFDMSEEHHINLNH
jgi:hypothetical protein